MRAIYLEILQNVRSGSAAKKKMAIIWKIYVCLFLLCMLDFLLIYYFSMLPKFVFFPAVERFFEISNH
jgi:hypothetical protein